MSVNWPKYPNAAVVEAILCIWYEKLDSGSLAILDDLTESLKVSYPDKSPRIQAALHFNVSDLSSPSSEKHLDGYILKTVSGNRRLQVTLDSLILHQLKPYSNWEVLVDEARRVWQILDSRLNLQPVKIGVRFINKFNVPKDAAVSEFLRIYPIVSPDLPDKFNQFFLRLEIPLPAGVFIAQLGFAPGDEPECQGLILDNDIQIPVEEKNNLWQQITEARNIKNQVFDACITEKTKKMIS